MQEYAQHWWLIALRGFFALIIGILALVYPIATISALLIVLGLYALIEGIIVIIFALTSTKSDSAWWVYLIEGMVGLVIGLFILKWPGMTMFLVIYLVGLWALIGGTLRIIGALSLRKEEGNLDWLLLIGGFAGLLLGILVLTNPASGLIALPILVGVYGLTMGIVLMVLGFRLRSYRD